MSTSMFGLSYDAADALTLATFWAATLDVTVAEGASPENATIDAPGWPRIGFHQVAEPKTAKNRLHLDLISDDLEAAKKRLISLGAVVVNEIDTGARWVTLADPEGNEFDVIQG